MTHDPLVLVAGARAACVAGDWGRAVAALVSAWEGLPSTRIALLAQQLSLRLPVQELPGKVAEREERWLELAASRDPSLLPTLLAGEWPVHPRAAKARLAELLTFPPDPRIALALHELWAAKRYRSRAGAVLWRRTFRTLLKWSDPFVGDVLRVGRTDELAWYAILEDIHRKLKGKAPAEPKLSKELERELAALEGVLGGSAASTAALKAKLLEAVYDDPASDAPRLVLADALLLEGDPRGELIQLQVASPAKPSVNARVRALLRARAATWLDGLEGLVEQPVFRRGFVAEATVSSMTRDLHPERRAWRTLEALRLGQVTPKQHDRIVKFLLHTNLAQLRRLEGLPAAAAARYLASAAGSLDHLELVTPLRPLPATRALVRELAVSRSETDERAEAAALDGLRAWFEALPFRASIERLVIDLGEAVLPQAWRWLQRTTLDTIILRPVFFAGQPMAWELRLSRAGRLEAIWNGRLYGERDPAGLGAAVAALPADALTEVIVRSAVRLAPEVRQGFTDELSGPLASQRRLVARMLFEG